MTAARSLPGLLLLRRVGLRLAARRALARLWSERLFLVLVADAGAGPPPEGGGPAMLPQDPRTFAGFARALEHADGAESLELRWRARWCADGVRGLYACADDDGTPLFAQWLIGPAEQASRRARHLAGTRRLAPDERILEGAYTFAAARGRGLMRTGMGRLLAVARAQGATRVWTYVTADNAAALRGCAAVGFVPDHARRERRRLGRRRHQVLDLDADLRSRWQDALA